MEVVAIVVLLLFAGMFALMSLPVPPQETPDKRQSSELPGMQPPQTLQ